MSETRLRPKLRGKELILAILRWILIIFFAVYTLFPLIWLVISSLKTNFEFLAGSPFALPAKPQWINYTNALTVAGLGRMLFNSVFVGLSATVVNIIVASMGAYCISRFRFKGREKIFTLFTAGILVPLNALMVPYFVIITKLGLINTYGGMILLYTAIGIPMSTFLIRGLMDSIPMELETSSCLPTSSSPPRSCARSRSASAISPTSSPPTTCPCTPPSSSPSCPRSSAISSSRSRSSPA